MVQKLAKVPSTSGARQVVAHANRPTPPVVRGRSGGNVRTGAMAETETRVRPRLEVGRIDDPEEREAEAAADAIVWRLAEVDGSGSSNRPEAATSSRVWGVGTDDVGGAPVPAPLEGAVRRTTRGGEPLDVRVRGRFEAATGHDLGSVRIHRDTAAAATAQALGARAYTLGHHIAFGPEGYAPGTGAGDRLLAHELVHVGQQTSDTRVRRDVPTTQVGPVSGEGGLIQDASRRRFNVIVRPEDTPRTIAARLLPLFTGARPFTPEGGTTPAPLEPVTAEDLAKALLVYHQHYLPVPAMTKWRVGLRLPIPIRQDAATGEGVLHPTLIRMWADSFDPSWTDLLDRRPGTAEGLAGSELREAARTFLRNNSTALARGIALSGRALTNAVEAEPLVREVLSQLGTGAFEVALQFMDNIVAHQVDVLAGQNAGRDILDHIRRVLENAPSRLSEAQQASLARANRMLNRIGVFEPAEGQAFGQLYAAEVDGLHCMSAVYLGLEALLGGETSRSIQEEVTREAREVMRRTGRDTNHMDRIMQTVRDRGLAGAETVIHYNRRQDEWQPDPQTTVLSMTHPGVSGWYFFGFSIHGAYHSVILAVDMTDPDTPHIYWMDQFSQGFTNEVTNAIEDEMRDFRPSYGFAVTRLWQIVPPSDLLIPLE